MNIQIIIIIILLFLLLNKKYIEDYGNHEIVLSSKKNPYKPGTKQYYTYQKKNDKKCRKDTIDTCLLSSRGNISDTNKCIIEKCPQILCDNNDYLKNIFNNDKNSCHKYLECQSKCDLDQNCYIKNCLEEKCKFDSIAYKGGEKNCLKL